MNLNHEFGVWGLGDGTKLYQANQQNKSGQLKQLLISQNPTIVLGTSP
jgi:hypothetical protein